MIANFAPLKSDHELWNGYRIPNMRVIKTNLSYDGKETIRIVYDTGVDTSVLWRETSGGNKIAFPMNEVGEFLVFKSRKHVVEVHIQTEVCSKGVCACGIIFRNGNEIYINNICNGVSRQGFIYIGNHEDGILDEEYNFDKYASVNNYYQALWNNKYWIPGITPEQHEIHESHTISLQNGVVISITRNFDTNSLELLIESKPYVESFDELDGIVSCRYKLFRHRDGSYAADYRGYINSWRVPTNESLRNPTNHMNFGVNETVYQCHCPQGTDTALADVMLRAYARNYYYYYYPNYETEHVLGAAMCSLQMPCLEQTNGQTWPYNTFVTAVIVSNVSIEHNNTHLMCLFNPVEGKKHRVQWYFDETIVLNHTINANSTVLSPVDIVPMSGSECNLDKEIRCSVTVFEANGVNQSGPSSFSEPVYLMRDEMRQSMVSNVCVINNTCYFEYDHDPLDQRYVCYPALDPFSWKRNLTLHRVPGDYCIPGEIQCESVPGVAFCKSKTKQCTCADTFEETNGACSQIGCTMAEQNDTCSSISFAICNDNVCSCASYAELNATHGKCDIKRIGSNCTSEVDCKHITGAACDYQKTNTCVCDRQFKFSNGKCAPKAPGDLCTPGGDDCDNIQGDAICSPKTKQCSCYDTWQVVGGKCQTISCTFSDPSPCKLISNGECRNGTCTCSIAAVLNTTTGECKSRGIGDTCYVDEACTFVKNAKCDSERNMCVCDDTRKLDGNACVPKEPGDACEPGSKNCQDISGEVFCDAVTEKCSCASTHTASNCACVQKRCTDDHGCGGIAHAKCLNNACTCSVTSELDITNGLCKSKGLGSFCLTDSECGLVTGAICDIAKPRVCVCGDKYEMNDAECILKQPGILYLNRVDIFVAQYIEHDEHFAIFRCDYSIDYGFFYQVKWYLHGEEIYSTDILDSPKASEASVLKDVELYNINATVFQFDSKLRCQVSAYNESGTFKLKTVESNEFVPMTISSTSITFSRGQSASFTVNLYVPFGCGTKSRDCQLQYLLHDPSDPYDCMDSTIAVLHGDTCGGRIEGSTKTDMETFALPKYETTITILAKNNNNYNLKRDFELKLRTFSDDNLKNLWQGFTITIEVHVTDDHLIQHSPCYSHVDPHMGTFDGRWYENQNSGEFILVRHKKYPIEVDMITQPCSNWGPIPTCACAVNVRAGGDIFTINHCSGHLTKYLSNKDQALKVYRESSSEYKIILPTGMSVNIYLMTWG
ncbi:hypothetical protein DPMN_073461 [Dreissena polymorpha]|uniref:VWFD domain-containing protein n=1 Tax=Dreissena polymorpha TaxID=45954 RepID=A0A9D4BZ42_DREPO|nr:hypothetical protein DPMN_073461 [Dreissena polymorpha]